MVSQGPGITRRWGWTRRLVSQGLGITRRWRGVDKEVGFTRTGYHKVRVHLPTNYKSHKP